MIQSIYFKRLFNLLRAENNTRIKLKNVENNKRHVYVK